MSSGCHNMNLAHILSNTSTIRMNIKWTARYILSGNITLTKNGTQKNTKSFIKIGPNQFTQLWLKLLKI